MAAVTSDLKVLGGGAYDGRINTDLVHDSNMLFRPFSMSYWHPAPRDVMVIGLSTGAWTQVLIHHPQVQAMTVVEINPGYFDLIRKYPEVSSLLTNPRITYAVDDGRRWLVRNPSARFDVIVSNTSFHWRGHISNLLSVEFLELIRQHLKPGGVFFYNLTSSPEALLTGVTVFPHAIQIGSCLAVSDTPFDFDIERWKRVTAAYRIDGKPLLDLQKPEDRQAFDNMSATYTRASREESVRMRARNAASRMITDDNMGMEWPDFTDLLGTALRR